MKGHIPPAFIDELISRNDIVELIDSYVHLKKRGQNFLACCPFHSEKNPSFTVSQTKQFFHCFGCGKHGNVITFLMEYNHLDFVGAIETLANKAGLEIPTTSQAITQRNTQNKALYPILEQASAFYQQQLRQHPQAHLAIDYLKQRGLSGQIAKEFAIGFAPPGWDNLWQHVGKKPGMRDLLLRAGLLLQREQGGFYDRFRERVMFPIRDLRGRVIGFGGRVLGKDTPKYMNSPETELYHKSKELYGLYEVLKKNRQLKQLIIVEGYLDVIALAQHGITNAIATLGTATTREHIQRLFRHAQDLIFCFDGDTAGKTAAWRALETALPFLSDGQQCHFVFLPQGEDPDSLVRSQGTSGFQKYIKLAQPLTDYFFQHLQEQVNMQSIDGRAKLIQLATPFLDKLPAGGLAQMMLERLGQLVRIDSHRLRSITHQKTSSDPYPKKPPRVQSPSTIRLTIALLLQHPEMISQIADWQFLEDLEQPETDILLKIIKLLKENASLTTGMLVEKWRNSPQSDDIFSLATWELPIPDQGVAEELLGAFQRLTAQHREQQIENLLAKASKQGLSTDEKQRLQQLFLSRR